MHYLYTWPVWELSDDNVWLETVITEPSKENTALVLPVVGLKFAHHPAAPTFITASLNAIRSKSSRGIPYLLHSLPDQAEMWDIKCCFFLRSQVDAQRGKDGSKLSPEKHDDIWLPERRAPSKFRPSRSPLSSPACAVELEQAGTGQSNGSRVSPPAVRRWIRSPARTRIISAAKSIPNHRRDDRKHKSPNRLPGWATLIFCPASAGRPLTSRGERPPCQPQYSSCSVKSGWELGTNGRGRWQTCRGRANLFRASDVCRQHRG